MNHTQAAPRAEPTAARDIAPGGCFRKLQGNLAYLRVAETAARFFGLPEGFVYGVAHNGNVAKIDPQAPVLAVPVEDLVRNAASAREPRPLPAEAR